jgi:flavorubredoxin
MNLFIRKVRGKNMTKALIVYASQTGNTKFIAEAIAAGLRETGIEVNMMNANQVTGGTDLAGYDIYLFGSATYHHEMMQPMMKFLLLAEQAGLNGKTGSAFGAYGWSGEAPKKIQEIMEYRFGMDVTEEPLKIKVPASSELLRKASEEFGRKIGESAVAQH